MSPKETSLQTKFIRQRARAKHRGIEWALTFEQWLEIWTSSGKLHLRGKGVGKYVMSRNGDTGPYSVENVTIAPYEQNSGDVNKNHPETCGWTKRIGLERGCYERNRGNRVTYIAYFQQKYLGTFGTPEAASNAYQVARSNYLETTK